MEVTLENEFKTFETIGVSNYVKLKQCVKNIINKEGYIFYNVDKKVLTPNGGNYLGILCEINIEGETSVGKKETNIFMKIISPDVKMTILSVPDAFERELFFYKKLSVIFSELQIETNIPIEERYNIVKSYEESDANVIILENMSKRGFKTNFRMDVITLQYAERGIRELAKFHALSFALESKKPIYFERNIKTISKTFTFDKDWDGFVQNMCQITLNYLDEDNRRKLQRFILSLNEKYRRYLDGKSGRLCLRHGDYRTNNILVKETDDKISEVIPIDYQLISYGCPILDFIYFIIPSTDQNFRRTHLQNLKELYYDTLKNFLKYFSLDIDDIYCRNDFESDYKEMLDFGLMVSIFMVPLLMVSENDVPDITKAPLAGLDWRVDSRCKDRLVGIVRDYIEWGYL